MPRKTKSPEGPRKSQIKFYATEAFKAEVDKFANDHPELGSMGDFGHAAFSFYMQKYRASGFVRDEHNFPKDIAAERIIPYETRGRPIHKK